MAALFLCGVNAFTTGNPRSATVLLGVSIIRRVFGGSKGVRLPC